MKTIVLAFLLSVFYSSTFADGLLEGFEVENQDPFNGSGELTWTGDVSDFEITTATWPYGSTNDFAGDHSLRSRDIGELNSTIITDISTVYSSALTVRWEVYVSGNSADITNNKGFAIILFVNSSIISNIEDGSVNGYRLRLADPDGEDGDGFYLEKASGSGWSKIDEYSITPSPNINEGWNVAVERESDGTWNWGFSNGAIGTSITLSESVVDNDHTTGDYSGMYWYSTAGDANDFGFDNFKVDPYTPGLWKSTASTSTWNSVENWDDEIIPTTTTDVTIPPDCSNFPVISTSDGNCNNLTLQPNARLTINNGYTLNVNGNFTIESTSDGTGSFLNNGTLNMGTKGTITFERYIEAWTTQEDGWHLISSPVNNFSVAGSGFVPGNNDDLYRWSEADNLWMNYKQQTFNFTNGNGYLCAYETFDTKEFTGSFNSTDISFSDLSIGDGSGWHLLGNPFPCAIKWNDGNWGLSGFEPTANVYDEAAGNYASLTSDDIIPATNGFFVKATNATNSITIPAASRTHDNTAFYKNYSDDFAQVLLKITSDQTTFFDRTKIRFHEDAGPDYDPLFDGHKILGQPSAPQLYSYSEDRQPLSVNTYPDYSMVSVQLGLEAGIDGDYYFTMPEISGFHEWIEIALEDTYTDTLFVMSTDTVYQFYATTDDDPQRFILHFLDYTSTDKNDIDDAVTVLFNDGYLHVYHTRAELKRYSLDILDIHGRLIRKEQIAAFSHYQLPVNLSPACYIVRITGEISFQTKIIVN